MILIITNKEDVHTTTVINILNKRNIPVFRLNTECLLTDYEITWWNTASPSRLIIKNKQNGMETGLKISEAIPDVLETAEVLKQQRYKKQLTSKYYNF